MQFRKSESVQNKPTSEQMLFFTIILSLNFNTLLKRNQFSLRKRSISIGPRGVSNEISFFAYSKNKEGAVWSLMLTKFILGDEMQEKEKMNKKNCRKTSTVR